MSLNYDEIKRNEYLQWTLRIGTYPLHPRIYARTDGFFTEVQLHKKTVDFPGASLFARQAWHWKWYSIETF